MRSTQSLVIALAAAISALGGAAVPAQAAAAVPASSTGTGSTVLVDCAHKAQVRPADFVLACADANDQLAMVRWTQWGTGSAVGTGYQRVNDCTPTCVAGKVHTYPVDIRLSDDQLWPEHGQLRHFTRLTLNYPGAQPFWQHRSEYDLWQ